MITSITQLSKTVILCHQQATCDLATSFFKSFAEFWAILFLITKPLNEETIITVFLIPFLFSRIDLTWKQQIIQSHVFEDLQVFFHVLHPINFAFFLQKLDSLFGGCILW